MAYIAGKNIYLFKSAMHSGTHSVWVSMAMSYLWWLDVDFTLWRTEFVSSLLHVGVVWIEWHWDKFVSKHLEFLPSSFQQFSMFTYHHGCIQ